MKKLLFIIYALLLVALTILSYAFVDANLIYYKKIFSNFAFQEREVVTVIYVVLISLLFVCYCSFLYLLHRKKIVFKDIKLLIAITCALLFFSYPAMLSYDIFNYIATAKVLFFYHENPYVIMPIEFVGDPMLLFTHAANKLALYGPGWISLTFIPHFLGMNNFVLTLLSFKLIPLVFYLFTLWIIWKITKNIYSLTLFAFNPLVIIETLVSGHNDIVMIGLALFSFMLIKEKKYFSAICFFIASVLIKYATLFLLPVFLFILWKSYKRKDINWKKIYYVSFISMLAIFLLSPLREEMYPWYTIWFLAFIVLIHEKKNLVYLSIAFSFGLMLRYIPFMYSGTHFGMTPVLRIVLAAMPVGAMVVYILYKRKSAKVHSAR